MQTFAHGRIELRRGRFFDQLLMRRLLHRTIAFAEVHDAAVFVAEHLHFDVTRRDDQLLDVHPAVFERRFGFAPVPSRTRRPFARPHATSRMPLPPPPAVALSSTG